MVAAMSSVYRPLPPEHLGERLAKSSLPPAGKLPFPKCDGIQCFQQGKMGSTKSTLLGGLPLTVGDEYSG